MGMKERKIAEIEMEFNAERAASLGRTAQRLQGALEALQRFDSGAPADKSRPELVAEASNACLDYLVQREALGFGTADREFIRQEYHIPQEVWRGMGSN
jgi:hypothetical protein